VLRPRFAFTTSAGGELAAGSNITLTYPSGFFAASASPTGTMSAVNTTLATISAPGATSIIMTTAGNPVAASTAVTITLEGLTIGRSGWQQRCASPCRRVRM